MDHDSVNYSQAVFDEIQGTLSQYLKDVGYTDIPFIPVAGNTGANIK